jgi:hypothetical protein
VLYVPKAGREIKVDERFSIAVNLIERNFNGSKRTA